MLTLNYKLIFLFYPCTNWNITTRLLSTPNFTCSFLIYFTSEAYWAWNYKWYRRFTKDFCKRISNTSMTYNVHQLLHLYTYVKRWGPLWANSAFPFESHNGFLTKTSHGTKNLRREIINNLKISEGANILRNIFKERPLSILSNQSIIYQTAVNNKF